MTNTPPETDVNMTPKKMVPYKNGTHCAVHKNVQ